MMMMINKYNRCHMHILLCGAQFPPTCFWWYINFSCLLIDYFRIAIIYYFITANLMGTCAECRLYVCENVSRSVSSLWSIVFCCTSNDGHCDDMLLKMVVYMCSEGFQSMVSWKCLWTATAVEVRRIHVSSTSSTFKRW